MPRVRSMFQPVLEWFGLALLACLLAGMGSSSPRAEGLANIAHEVLAFYYGWYRHGDWTRTARWTPSDGAYDSMDAAVIERQLAEAEAAGITGLIASWWPSRGRYTDAQIPRLLAAGRRHGVRVSALVEDFARPGGHGTTDSVLADLDYVFAKYGEDPGWLKVSGRPVVFVYSRALQALPTAAAWDTVLARLRAAHPGAIVLSDGQGLVRTNPQARASFDGLFSYGIASRTHGQSAAQIRTTLGRLDAGYVAEARRGDIACLVVAPGYDDTRTDRPAPRPVTDRFAGETYRATWQAALAARPDWILVSTFNEWMEGTQIEPSAEFGSTALDATAAFSKAFLASPTRP